MLVPILEYSISRPTVNPDAIERVCVGASRDEDQNRQLLNSRTILRDGDFQVETLKLVFHKKVGSLLRLGNPEKKSLHLSRGQSSVWFTDRAIGSVIGTHRISVKTPHNRRQETHPDLVASTSSAP